MSGTFHADPRRLAAVTELVLRAVPEPAAPLRVLDIGCGTGDQIFNLATRLPAAQFTGVDIVAANVEAARRRQRQSPHGARMTFVAADYLEFNAPTPFEVAFSFSVLQFVPGGPDALASKIAADLGSGATLINVMPYRCGYNEALTGVRRALRSIRSEALDSVVLRLASLVYRGTIDTGLLAERLPYLYQVPLQFEDDLAQVLERRGVETVDWEPFPHASVAQLKHAARTMRKTA